MIRIRLFIGSCFMWVAYRIMPHDLAMAIRAGEGVVLSIIDEKKIGHNWGVLSLPWFYDDDGEKKSFEMLYAMSDTAKMVRKKYES